MGLYFLFSPMLGIEGTGWLCILGAAPFAACGFFRYHGMTAEQFAWVWFQSEFLTQLYKLMTTKPDEALREES